ncbi:ATP synthase subunit C lysine N-methyltransferase [Leptinotarsa decemlineata]|uniref:ATP synthase subunit C lysine N-methyltransferase n=1 Tax=Leptinotarsa decemlineata TaxID=7539 RepID=UPI003D3056D2
MNSSEFFNALNRSEINEHKKVSSFGRLLVGITGGIAFGVTVICIPFITPALRKVCLPYVPATNNQIKNILLALEGRSGTLLDLGSGDGRVVLETAKNKFVSHGVELNRWLVYYSKLSALKNGLASCTKFYQRDLWKYNISAYDNIVIFGVEQMMNDLEKKFQSECKENCYIIACRFPLPNWTPIRTLGHGIDKVWIYDRKKF